MGGLIQYSAVATKIRAMESQLLSDEDFSRLASMDSVTQAVEYLNRIPAYKAILEDVDIANIHRGDIERLMVGTLYYDFVKLYRFSQKKQREVMKLYFQKYEIVVLKQALRRVFNHGDRTGEGKSFWDILQKYTRIHLDEVGNAETMQALMHALRDTDYCRLLTRLDNTEQITLFDYEMTLDLYYFTELWKRKNRFLKGKEQKQLTKTFGSRIDLLNMMWIYRSKKYYQLSENSIYALIIPVTYRLREDEIRAMVASAGTRELDEVIHRTYYGKRFLELNGQELEQFYHQFLRKLYLEEKRREPYSMAVVTAYLYEKEEEIDKLTTILEGVRYGMPPEETLSYAGQHLA
jgi:V/A-type H+-transporting ATPase subunit C